LLAALVLRLCDPARRDARLGPTTADGSDDDGSILVFLPGVPEIRRLHRELERVAATSGGASTPLSALHILHLHGNLSALEQSQVFARPPRGKRKVILSTNVAETSITIDDVTVSVLPRNAFMCFSLMLLPSPARRWWLIRCG